MSGENRNIVWAERLLGVLRSVFSVRYLVMSPGSRSSPVVCAAAEPRSGIEILIQIDERSAAYFALGLAKATQAPVAALCTSGTAAANFHPAVVEASHAGIPLLLLTADRPPEERGIGSPQTIDQIRLFGSAVRDFVELPLPDDSPGRIERMETLVARAALASLEPVPGPVQINVPFREPLAPVPVPPGDGAIADLSAVSGARPRRLRLPVAVPRVVPSPDRSRIEWAAGRVAHAERGLILAGPDSVRSSEDRFALLRLARLTCFPVLADVASGIRFPAPFEDTMAGPGALLCSRADAFLRAPALRRGPAPDLVLWWGELPTSKAIREYLVASRPEVLRIQRDARVCDPDGTVTGSLLGDTAETASLLADLMPQQRAPDRWRERFLRAERAAGSVEREVGEADAVRLALAACPAGAAVVLSNSMPVRWAETYAAAGKYLRVFVQRGANGIDGIVSTAFGIARGTAAPLLLVTGDLAFLHDLGGLRLARYARAPVAILLLDNEGGGIFAHLPIAQFAELDPYFRTPHGCDLAAAAEVFGLRRVALDSPRSTPEAVDLALSQQTGGTMLLHLKTDAAEAAKQHRERMERVAQAVGSELPATRD